MGTPDELYAAPANRFVGGFVGRSSVVPVTVLGPTAWGTRIAVEGVEWEIERPAGHPVMLPGPALLLVRPEALRLGDDPQAHCRHGDRAAVHRTLVLFTVMTAGGADARGGRTARRRAARASASGILPSRRAAGGLHLFPADGG